VATDQEPTALDQAHELRVALEGLSSALGSGDPDAVLRAEAPLAAAVAACARPAAVAGEGAAVLDEVTRASRLLARCRASGVALAALLEATLDVLGRDGAYDRQGGRPVTGSIRRHDLQARV
jgi:hypothetical protein